MTDPNHQVIYDRCRLIDKHSLLHNELCDGYDEMEKKHKELDEYFNRFKYDRDDYDYISRRLRHKKYQLKTSDEIKNDWNEYVRLDKERRLMLGKMMDNSKILDNLLKESSREYEKIYNKEIRSE